MVTPLYLERGGGLISVFHFNGYLGVLTIEKANKCSVDHEKAIEDILEAKVKYRKIIQAGIARWVKDFQDGRISITTVDDLKKLIEVDMYLQKEEIYFRKLNSRQ